MNLLRLLAVGKSLIGIKGDPSEYKLTQENLVPKFTSQPPNWSASAKPSAEAVVKRGEFAKVSVAAETSALEEAAAYGKSTDVLEEPAESASAMQAEKEQVEKQSGPEPSRAPRADEEYMRAKFAPKKASAQGELPLLGVVRNDLSDADLEVALAGPRSAVKPAGGGMRTRKSGDKAVVDAAAAR